MIAARLDTSKIARAYIHRLWKTDLIRSQIMSSARTTNGTFKINQGSLERLRILLPPLGRQQQFEQRAVVVSRFEKKARIAIAESAALFRGLSVAAFGPINSLSQVQE